MSAIDLKAFDPVTLHPNQQYSLVYNVWLDFLRMAAALQNKTEIKGVPATWVPFLEYMGHSPVADGNSVYCSQPFTPNIIQNLVNNCEATEDYRTLVEVMASTHAVLAHALYLFDCEWQKSEYVKERSTYEPKAGVMIPVASHGAFFRQEFMKFMRLAEGFKTERKFAVLFPCSADKPLPAAEHRAVVERVSALTGRDIESDCEFFSVSGTLGLIPWALADKAPLYDAGVPNHQRVEQSLCRYFIHNRFKRVVVYADFYSEAVSRALRDAGVAPYDTTFCFPVRYTTTYGNLMDDTAIRTFARVFAPKGELS